MTTQEFLNIEQNREKIKDLIFGIMEDFHLQYDEDELNDIDPELLPSIIDSVSDGMKELLFDYTKEHITSALKSASNGVKLTDFAYEFLQEGASEAIDKETILNSYPEENFK